MNCIWTLDRKNECPFFSRVTHSSFLKTGLQAKEFIGNIDTANMCIICNQISLLGMKPELNLPEVKDFPPVIPFKATEDGYAIRSLTLDEINEVANSTDNIEEIQDRIGAHSRSEAKRLVSQAKGKKDPDKLKPVPKPPAKAKGNKKVK